MTLVIVRRRWHQSSLAVRVSVCCSWIGLSVGKKDVSFLIRGGSSTGHQCAGAFVGGVSGSTWGVACSVETDLLGWDLVAGVQRPLLATNEQPAETTTDGLEKIQRIQSVKQCLKPTETSLVGWFGVSVEAGCFDVLNTLNRVFLKCKCPQVQDGEYGHLNGNE